MIMQKQRLDFLADYDGMRIFDPEVSGNRENQRRPRALVDGRDDRKIVTQMDMIPFCFVGQVLARSRRARGYVRYGTVFLIGRDIVATAGHNLYVRDQPADQWDIYFGVMGDRGVAAVYHYVVVDAVHYSGYRPNDTQSRYDVARMTIAPVARALPSDYGFLRVVRTNPGQLIGTECMVTGYPDSVPAPFRSSRSDNASQYYHFSMVTGHAGGRVFYSNDTSEGQSGSPLVVRVVDEAGVGMSAAAGIHVTGWATPSSNAAVAMESSIIDFLFGRSVA